MNVQEMIRNIMEHPNATATSKRKHLSHLMLHLGDYSENADELEAAYITITECIEIVTNQEEMELFQKKHLGTNVYGNMRSLRNSGRSEQLKQLRVAEKKKDKGADGKITIEQIKEAFNLTKADDPITTAINNAIKQQTNLKGESDPMTYDELNRVLEFLLMFNILTIFQVQEIRAKALPYCK